jgi:phage terminase large subunit-like protein
LIILDWDIAQIEGATLAVWLPQVFDRLERLTNECRARHGSTGVHIEDKNSGTILLQQAKRGGLQVHPIESKLTAKGKDERALAASPFVYQGRVKYSDYAFQKIVSYKGKSRNHFLEQVEGFRIGDKKSDREDDLLDTFCYGIALALDKGRY